MLSYDHAVAIIHDESADCPKTPKGPMQIRDMNGSFSQSIRSFRGNYPIHLGSMLAALVLCFLSIPLLLRSPWVDEIMLFLNYPPGFPRALTQPLEWYHQAATPLYSMTIGQLGDLRPEIVRLVSTFIIAFCSVLLLSHRSKSLATVGYASLAILLFPQPFHMLSEMKHYGLEIVGTLLAIRWFVDKPSTEAIGSRDVLMLALSALLGLSTIPVAGIALGTHVTLKIAIHRRMDRIEALHVALFTLFLLGYYAWVKHLMVFLTYNFSYMYADNGPTENLKDLARTFVAVGGGSMKVLLFLIIPFAFVAYQARGNIERLRLTLITSAIALAFVLLSALGFYPARENRFVTWTVAFLWVYVVTILSLIPHETRLTSLTKVKYAFLGMVVLSAFTHVWGLWWNLGNEFSSTANNKAISELRSLPPSNVGFWAGGEPVVDYYRRFYPDLNKHYYFGRINWKSRYSKFDPSTIDYFGRANAMLQEAPANAEFIVFASHYVIDGSDRYNQPKSSGLHAALQTNDCSYVPNNFKRVTIYKVTKADKE
jgi:hypothetical protein